MAVRIRLKRRGRRKLPLYDVVVADARAPRDGKFIQKIGRYDPNSNPAKVELNEEMALSWLLNGAQPSSTVRAMLSYSGVLLRKHLQVGVGKKAITQQEADKRYDDWKRAHEMRVAAKVASVDKIREQEREERRLADLKRREKKEAAQALEATADETPPQEVAPAPESPVEPSVPPSEMVEASKSEVPTESAPKTDESVGEAKAKSKDEPKEVSAKPSASKPSEASSAPKISSKASSGTQESPPKPSPKKSAPKAKPNEGGAKKEKSGS